MAKLSQPYPTRKEEAALRDVLKHPTASLAERAVRLGVTRAGVHHLLTRAALKGMAESVDRGWEVTLAGRKWLRPLMGERRSA